MPENLNSILPITVVAAIVLFVIKEVVEFIKRILERRRKISAYKVLLSEELAKNSSALGFLKRICNEINDGEVLDVSYKKTSSGTDRLTVRSASGSSNLYFWTLHSSVFERLVAELAAADRDLFTPVSKAYAKISEVKHVRESIIDFTELDMPKHLFQGLGSYGIARIDDAVSAVSEAYLKLSGKELTDVKLRSYV